GPTRRRQGRLPRTGAGRAPADTTGRAGSREPRVAAPGRSPAGTGRAAQQRILALAAGAGRPPSAAWPVADPYPPAGGWQRTRIARPQPGSGVAAALSAEPRPEQRFQRPRVRPFRSAARRTGPAALP